MVFLISCDHKFVYGGVKYRRYENADLGLRAWLIYYYDWFYCERCLKQMYEKLNIKANTYEPILFNATPISGDHYG